MTADLQRQALQWLDQRDEAVAERDNLLREVADLTKQRDYLRALCGKVPQLHLRIAEQRVALEALTEDARP